MSHTPGASVVDRAGRGMAVAPRRLTVRQVLAAIDSWRRRNGDDPGTRRVRYSYQVTWSVEDGEFVATCTEFPSLSWLADSQATALQGLVDVVADTVDLVSRASLSPNHSQSAATRASSTRASEKAFTADSRSRQPTSTSVSTSTSSDAFPRPPEKNTFTDGRIGPHPQGSAFRLPG